MKTQLTSVPTGRVDVTLAAVSAFVRVRTAAAGARDVIATTPGTRVTSGRPV